MIKFLFAPLVALSLLGCVTTGLAPDTPEKQAVAFCNGFAGALQNMTIFKAAGKLSVNDIAAIDDVVATVEPYCTSTTIGAPTQALVNALDRIIIIQMAKKG